MRIQKEYKDFNGEQVWEAVVRFIEQNKQVTSVTGKVFSVTFVGSCLFIKGGTPGTKRAEKGEYLTAKDFISAYDSVKDWEEINTGNVKQYIRRQQTPFIALLHCTGIIR